MSLWKALEHSIENDGATIRVVVKDVKATIRQVRRIWEGKVGCAVTEEGTGVWGRTLRTPKSEQDFRLLITEG